MAIVNRSLRDKFLPYRTQYVYDTEEQYEEIIATANEMLDISILDAKTARLVKWMKALSCLNYADQIMNYDCSWSDETNCKAYSYINQAEILLYEFGNEYGWNDKVIVQLMRIFTLRSVFYKVRNYAIVLLGSKDQAIRSLAIDVYESSTEQVFMESKFTINCPYEMRKFVFIGRDRQQIGGTYQLEDKNRVVNWIFTIDHLPDDIVFPLGRPQSGLYMAHPVKTDRYYPKKGVEETLFMEKVREFCWLVQCLGATEVSFHSNKGLSVSQGMGSSMNVNTEVGVRKVNVGGGYSNSMKRDESYTSNQQVELVQHFSPKKQAYCPDDLIWLDSDPAWLMLLKQRLEGGIMEYTYKISSSETCQISTNEMEEVKANFEYIMVKANGSYNASTDNTFSRNEETEWSLHVKFAPLEELGGQNSSNKTEALKLSDDEAEYIDAVKECMEDGEIGVRERKLLDKIRVKNGISEERAKELEATLSAPQLTDDEKEYLEAFKDACEDGKVSDKQRRLLEKLRVMYGISEERAKEIEDY